MPVNEETNLWAKQVRELHKTRLTQAGYEGFRDSIDDEYHAVGVYFFVRKDQSIVLTSRVNTRNSSYRFPFEMGERPDGKSYIYQDASPSVDINTYSLIPKYRKKAMPLLLASIGKYIKNLQAKRAFCLVDRENKAVQRIYQEAKFFYSPTFNESIAFPSFLRTVDQLPVQWRIMEWDEAIINYYSQMHRDLSVEKLAQTC